jgi:hypothetical protein
MKHRNLSVVNSLIIVFDFLKALGYNTNNLTVEEAITLKNNIFTAIEESDVEVQLES